MVLTDEDLPYLLRCNESGTSVGVEPFHGVSKDYSTAFDVLRRVSCDLPDSALISYGRILRWNILSFFRSPARCTEKQKVE